MRGFGNGVEEQRQYFRSRTRQDEPASLAVQRHRFQERWVAVLTELAAA